MNKKFFVIQVLKQRISNMQRQIHKLQKVQTNKQNKSKSKSVSKSKQKTTSPNRKTSSNTRYKSPTFWTGNPILGQQNPYFSHKSISPSKKMSRNQSFVYKSPLAQKIQKDVDLSFYQSAPISLKQKQNLSPLKNQIKEKNTNENNFQIFKQIMYGPKVQKKKTFEFPKKDPILNPQPYKISCRKSPIKLCSSPKNMYLENPNSNPDIYFYDTQPIKLSPKPRNNRNISPDLKLLLSNSTQNLRQCNKPQKSNRKHYGRYYNDQSSKWNHNW